VALIALAGATVVGAVFWLINGSAVDTSVEWGLRVATSSGAIGTGAAFLLLRRVDVV
jgi:hypothetical protein